MLTIGLFFTNSRIDGGPAQRTSQGFSASGPGFESVTKGVNSGGMASGDPIKN